MFSLPIIYFVKNNPRFTIFDAAEEKNPCKPVKYFGRKYTHFEKQTPHIFYDLIELSPPSRAGHSLCSII